jgi:tRNA-specific 2-thiouridylase
LVSAEGKVLGRHAGHQHFTIGQRKGVGVAFGHPIYVVDIDPGANRVMLGEKEQLRKSELMARQVNWLSDRACGADRPIRCSAKIRYNHEPASATVWVNGDEMRVEFDEPQTAITPGQAVAVYDGDVLLGGGWIEK